LFQRPVEVEGGSSEKRSIEEEKGGSGDFEINIGDQFDTFRHGELNYFNNFEEPLVTRELKQIKSTFISRVECGLEHSLLLTSSGFVYAMGFNTYGQLGGDMQVMPG
jgi:alpha-tubulin suppressor-like RCC1 family protein